MAQFFIRRPVFAWVIAIVIMLGGGLGLLQLSISRYPDIAPPTVQISATYPGASAETIENSVTKIVEQNMTGLDGFLYMSSNSASSGSASITLTFENGTDPDIAQVQAQNKLAQITSQLPEAVQRQGITVTKSSSGILMVAALTSSNPAYTSTDLADLVTTNLEDAIRRVPGVGDLGLFGSGYAMRIWLDPAKLAQFQLTPEDVTSAITSQNSQISVGQLGASPQAEGTQMNFTITSQSQLETDDQFRAIILKTATDGSLVTIGDVARVEIGAESYATSARYNGQAAAGFRVSLAAGANAVDTAEGVREAVEALQDSLPSDVEVVYPNDTTPFVLLAIEKVVHTLVEAVILVFVVMFVFLQNWRATLIPTIAVPVVLLGTLGVLAVAGFSINTLTMFAMVLAIGLLVDDAIVVVENVERVMEEEGLGPREATEKSMREITGALVGIALVLSAVFLPMAFFGGSVGIIYQQFSITIVTAMLLSVVVAVVLTPALCATLLKPSHDQPKNRFFRTFNAGFASVTRRYEGVTGRLIVRPIRVFGVFILICVAAAYLFARLPSSFIPPEDQGVLMTQIELPVGATSARTAQVIEQVEHFYLTQEGANVEGILATLGYAFGGNGQNYAMAFVRLKPFDQRTGEGQDAASIAARAMRAFSRIADARVVALSPPALPGLGQSGGFDMYLQDAGGQGAEALADAGDNVLTAAAADQTLAGVRRNGTPTQPQLDMQVDHQMAGALGLDVSGVNDVLSTAWAGRYVNDFNNNGRIKPVYVQADAPFRTVPSDINRWYARNSNGEMVPFSAFTQNRWELGPARLERFNGLGAINIQGAAASGTSSGEAMEKMEQLVADLGPGWSVEWGGLSYQERLSGSQAPLLYALSVLVVFLCLAALYESWTVPFSVILAVPIGVLGALIAASMTGLSNDIYFKVGLLTTIGLAAKNAILIVEFARELQANGRSLQEAALEAARLRLRPILMTSFAFILGVLPLAVSTGAGAGAQQAIGIGVMGGMLAATLLGIFFVPVFFAGVMRLSRRLTGGRDASASVGTIPHRGK